ncbi:hypothetical protein M193_gp034 [Halorubrum tailed phage 7]|uniref:hypothetical protein n=1 Tax=Halorubrum tailed phage 7 TaxID=2847108 RepID=UPI0003348399|nr:hypothetical protein M193_gp034 [Halorubrum tailed phage 7]AGM10906.1 hypothetical protein HRTV7_34 [Halorubrum tailed phage 7]
MATKRILFVPEKYDGPIDPSIDEVIVDETITEPYADEKYISEAGEGAIDRNLVNEDRRNLVFNAISDYETESAKDEPNPQIQLDALERAISYMWDVVSGEDVGSEAARSVEQEE